MPTVTDEPRDRDEEALAVEETDDEAPADDETDGEETDGGERERGRSAEPETRSSWAEVLLGFRWPLTLFVLAFLVHVTASRSCRTIEERPGPAAEAIVAAGEAVGGIAERFRSGTITTTFTAAIPRLVTNEGMSLEVAVLEGTETFSRSDERRVLFDLVDLGTTETEIRVPVTYRYNVDLEGEWRIDVRDHACIVHAPPIRPTLPPAIHTDRMEKRASRGWARFDVDEQMEALERSITPTLSERAAAPEAIDLVRERARRRVAEFVRNWLLVEDHWREDRFRSVTVIFADEEVTDAELPDPTVVLMRSERGE